MKNGKYISHPVFVPHLSHISLNLHLSHLSPHLSGISLMWLMFVNVWFFFFNWVMLSFRNVNLSFFAAQWHFSPVRSPNSYVRGFICRTVTFQSCVVPKQLSLGLDGSFFAAQWHFSPVWSWTVKFRVCTTVTNTACQTHHRPQLTTHLLSVAAAPTNFPLISVSFHCFVIYLIFFWVSCDTVNERLRSHLFFQLTTTIITNDRR